MSWPRTPSLAPSLGRTQLMETTMTTSLRSTFVRLARRISGEMEFRRQTRMLATLDDRMLADIGIWRGEITSVVRSIGRDRTRRAR
jgi:uncharacterized protein YjiS (DUF1127 family)